LIVLFHRQGDARVHAGLELVIAIRDFNFHRRGSRGRIEHRCDTRDLAVELFTGIGIDLDDRGIARRSPCADLFRPRWRRDAS
jgi:hypothetical protein